MLWFSNCFSAFFLLDLTYTAVSLFSVHVLFLAVLSTKHHDPHEQHYIIVVCFQYIGTNPLVSIFADVVKERI